MEAHHSIGHRSVARRCRFVVLAAGLALLATLVPTIVAGSPAAAMATTFATSGGGAGFDVAWGVDIDASGNSYISGEYSGSATFGATTLVSEGFSDAFVTKLDSTGGVLWATSLGGASADKSNGVGVDGAGNSYVAGFFVEEADFGTITLTSAGGTEAFVAKLDSSGVVVWATAFAGIDLDTGWAITADTAGNSYVTGSFGDMLTLGATTLTSAGGSDVFVAKLDTSGTVVWATGAGGIDADGGFGITVDDGSGETYVTGSYSDSATFGSTTLTSAGDADAFVTKLDAAGAVAWATSMGGTGFDRGSGVAVDASGVASVIGSFSDSATFGSTTLTSAGARDVFVAKLDTAGAVTSAIGFGNTGDDAGSAIAVDGFGETFVTGFFNGSLPFGAVELISVGSADIFAARLNDMNVVTWATSAGDTSGDASYGLALDASSHVYIAGRFVTSATFGATTLTSAGVADAFIAKLDATPLAFCNGQAVTINSNLNGGSGIGTAAADVILGTPGIDDIRGQAGDDLICAGDGDDMIRGGAGSDTIFGEAGLDTIVAGGGGDQVDGGADADTIRGGGGLDTIDGGDGDDVIDGQGAADTIDGGVGNDTINGQNGADILSGGDGNDGVKGHTGPDTLRGDADDDDLAGGGGDDTLFGGPGVDKCAGNTGPADMAEAATCETTPGVEILF